MYLKNIRVIDGDTIEADIIIEKEIPFLQTKIQGILRRKIRIWGIDTPERFGRTYLKEEKVLANLLKDFLELWFAKADKITFIPKAYPDSFGRALGEICIWEDDKGTDLGVFLFDNGFCRLWDDRNNQGWSSLSELNNLILKIKEMIDWFI